MAKTVETFLREADLEGFIREGEGLNLSYRTRMLKALASEDNEMTKLGEIFKEAHNRQVDEDIRLMEPAFITVFMALYVINGGDTDTLSR